MTPGRGIPWQDVAANEGESFLLEQRQEKVVARRWIRVFIVGVDEHAPHAHLVEPLLELHAEVGRVGRVLLLLADRRAAPIPEVNRRVIRRDERVWRVFVDPRQDFSRSARNALNDP